MVISHDMNTSIACQPAPSSYFKSHDIINDEMASDVIEHDHLGHTLVSSSRTIKFLFNPMISLLHCQENNVQTSWEDFMFSSIRQISSLEGAVLTCHYKQTRLALSINTLQNVKTLEKKVCRM